MEISCNSVVEAISYNKRYW